MWRFTFINLSSPSHTTVSTSFLATVRKPPLLKHESPLHCVLQPNRQVLPPEVLARTMRVFMAFIQCYKDNEMDWQQCRMPKQSRSYHRMTLTHETYKHCKDKDAFLQHFFISLDSMICGKEDEPNFNKGLEFAENSLANETTYDKAKHLLDFADNLLVFFFKMKTLSQDDTMKTPLTQASEEPTPVYARHKTLWELCLIREKNRCPGSELFNESETFSRWERYNGQLLDDDGKEMNLRGHFTHLEVAHIIPISLMVCPKDKTELTGAQKLAISILNMFAPNISATLNGEEIDTPKNAITLSKSLRDHFGNFTIFFDEIPDKPHTYKMDSYKKNISFAYRFPKVVKLQNKDRQDIDPPCPHLLRIHRAVAEILHLSAAGEYIDNIARESEEPSARADGTTDIGAILAMKVGLNGYIRSRGLD